MKKNRKKDKIYGSMEEFEKTLFPNCFKKRLMESMKPDTLAVTLADKSLEEVKRRLVK